MSELRTVVCHTQGCENNGAPIQLDLTVWDMDTDQPIPGELCPCACGPCGQPITDITDVKE